MIIIISKQRADELAYMRGVRRPGLAKTELDEELLAYRGIFQGFERCKTAKRKSLRIQQPRGIDGAIVIGAKECWLNKYN